jgi:hypothetical protein
MLCFEWVSKIPQNACPEYVQTDFGRRAEVRMGRGFPRVPIAAGAFYAPAKCCRKCEYLSKIREGRWFWGNANFAKIHLRAVSRHIFRADNIAG